MPSLASPPPVAKTVTFSHPLLRKKQKYRAVLFAFNAKAVAGSVTDA
jgi:hypothetical protein